MTGIEPVVLTMLLAGAVLPIALGVILRQGMFMFWIIGGSMIFVPYAFYDGVNASRDIDVVSVDGFVSTEIEVGNTILTEDYTTNAGWTQVGTLVTVDSGTADALDFANVDNGATDRRVHQSLGTTISGTFELEFAVNIQAKNIPSHPVVSMTVTNGNPRTTSEDGMLLFYGTGAFSGVGDAFAIVEKDDSSSVALVSDSQIAVTNTGQYYVRFERLASDNGRLSVFTDAAMTTHVNGSPVTFALTSSNSGYQYIQHGNWNTGSGTRTLDLVIDDLVVTSVTVVFFDTSEETYSWRDNVDEWIPEVRILMVILGFAIMFWGPWQQFFL